MGYQTLGTIGVSTTHTTDVPYQNIVQRGEARLDLLASPQGTTWLKLLASLRVRTLRGITPLKTLTWAWVLTSYYFGRIFLVPSSSLHSQCRGLASAQNGTVHSQTRLNILLIVVDVK